MADLRTARRSAEKLAREALGGTLGRGRHSEDCA